MKIVKAIQLSDDNLQEIMECPVVYRISKLELDPIDQRMSHGNLGAKEKPTILVFVQGFELPCGINTGFLVQDEKGYWRFLKTKELEELNNAK